MSTTVAAGREERVPHIVMLEPDDEFPGHVKTLPSREQALDFVKTNDEACAGNITSRAIPYTAAYYAPELLEAGKAVEAACAGGDWAAAIAAVLKAVAKAEGRAS